MFIIPDQHTPATITSRHPYSLGTRTLLTVHDGALALDRLDGPADAWFLDLEAERALLAVLEGRALERIKAAPTG